MKYAEIKITIEVDESKLTSAQQEQAEKSDKDPFNWEHPLEPCVDVFIDAIRAMAQSTICFDPLGDGKKSVSVEVDTA